MNIKPALALALIWGPCLACAQPPDLLIVQLKSEQSDDARLVLSSYVAEELDKEGRVRPVVWSTLDPVFREWTERDNFGAFVQYPNLKEALAKAQRLGVEHVLAVQAFRKSETFVATAELYVGGRQRWRFGPRNPNKNTDISVATDGRYDDKATKELQSRMPELLANGGTFTVYTGGAPDWDASARSLARTWRTLLGEGPLKKFPEAPRLPSEELGAGKVSDPVVDSNDAKADNVVAIANDLVANGKLNKALSLLREACDLRPYEVPVRKALVAVLIDGGMPEEAANVAQAAARIQPADPSLWLTVSQAWVAAGDADKAGEALKEAQARGVDGPTVERISADLALLNGDPQKAVEHYSKLEGAGAKLRYAAALALTGELVLCEKALIELQKTPVVNEDYTAIVTMIDRMMPSLSKAASDIPPLVRLHPGEPETLKSAEEVAKKCEALRELITWMIPPKLHAESHEARKLAHILLAQATLEAQKFAQSNDPEIGEEAVATLGQALRLLPSIQEKFGLEQRYGSL